MTGANSIKVIKRHCGGWLATADIDGLRIGVTADTEAAVRAKLQTSLWAWWDLGKGPPNHNVIGYEWPTA